MAGKKQHMAPMWKKLMKHADVDEPTSFLDHVHLGCTQRECNPNEIGIEQYKEMFESRISAGATKKLPGGKNLTQRRWQGPTAKVSNPCLDDHQFKKEEFESTGEL